MSVFQSKGHHIYFAYGSNMHPEQIAERCGSPEVVGIARLKDHRLAFFGHSPTWDGAEEAVVPQEGEEVWGVLYRLSFAEADQLDAWQGVRADGCGPYFLFPVFAVDDGGVSHVSLLYKKDSCGTAGLPSQEQRAFIVAGARAQGLPEAYVDRLLSLPAKKAAYPVPRSESRWRNLLSSVCRACG